MRACAWFVIATVVAGCALGETVRPASAPSRQAPPITIRVVRPDGAGPFPAVVWLHGCGGVVRGARHLEDWTRRLVRLDYVVAIPDSLSERGYPNGICGNGTLVPAPRRAEDAYAALRHLEGRPDVIAERIGLIGFSHGGWTVLATMDQDAGARARAAAGATRGFTAAIAFYPECAAGSWVSAYRAAAPLLILIGELDDWTLARDCRAMIAKRSGIGAPARLVVVSPALASPQRTGAVNFIW